MCFSVYLQKKRTRFVVIYTSNLTFDISSVYVIFEQYNMLILSFFILLILFILSPAHLNTDM